MSDGKKITANELKELLGIKALSEDELEMVTGGSSSGVNLNPGEEVPVDQCQDEAMAQLQECTTSCQYAGDKLDCQRGCEDAYWDAIYACDLMLVQ